MNEQIINWFDANKDPRTEIVRALCEIVESVDRRVVGEIKWNAPSYRIVDHFATTGFGRGSDVRLELHRGAKVSSLARPVITDPNQLLAWKSDDRAVFTFDSLAEVERLRNQIGDIVREWISQTQ